MLATLPLLYSIWLTQATYPASPRPLQWYKKESLLVKWCCNVHRINTTYFLSTEVWSCIFIFICKLTIISYTWLCQVYTSDEGVCIIVINNDLILLNIVFTNNVVLFSLTDFTFLREEQHLLSLYIFYNVLNLNVLYINEKYKY